MPRAANPLQQLESTITQLQEKRRNLVTQLAEIDGIFSKFGIQPEERKRPGRKPGRPPAPAVAAAPAAKGRGGRRKRGVYAMSAQESILEFLKGRGDRGAITSEINEHWASEGRPGNAYVTLGQLTSQRKIRKENLKGERGSRYTAP